MILQERQSIKKFLKIMQSLELKQTTDQTLMQALEFLRDKIKIFYSLKNNKQLKKF